MKPKDMPNMKRLTLLAIATTLMVSCGKREKEWKGPITENLPDSIIAIETDGDTLTMRELEALVDSFNYYINLYSNE